MIDIAEPEFSLQLRLALLLSEVWNKKTSTHNSKKG